MSKIIPHYEMHDVIPLNYMNNYYQMHLSVLLPLSRLLSFSFFSHPSLSDVLKHLLVERQELTAEVQSLRETMQVRNTNKTSQ